MNKLKEAEAILIKVLEDETVTSREYLVALVTTYFSQIKERRKTGGQKNKEI
jgi:hypothetical protein